MHKYIADFNALRWNKSQSLYEEFCIPNYGQKVYPVSMTKITDKATFAMYGTPLLRMVPHSELR